MEHLGSSHWSVNPGSLSESKITSSRERERERERARERENTSRKMQTFNSEVVASQ